MPSLYETTVPLFIHSLQSMSAFLGKGKAFADETGMAHSELLEAKLYEDMFPLPYQVQRASDAAKFTVVRLGKLEAPAMEDTETTFAELQDRIAATIGFLKTVPADALDGRETVEIEIKTPNRTFSFSGTDYVTKFALPNFFFHATTTYALLRMKGVPVGKIDFLGGV